MSTMTRDGTPLLGATPDRRAAAIGMLNANRDARAELEAAIERHDQATWHIIVAAWNYGLPEYRIAEAAGLSRRAVKGYLTRANDRGMLTRRRFPAEGSGRRAKVPA